VPEELRICLLGRPVVESGSGPVKIASHKAKALLWYLASQPDHEFSRSHLAALLWVDSPEQEGRQSLSTTLNRLRQALPYCPIEAHNDRLSWHASSEVWADTTIFRKLTASTTDIAALAEAVELWRGPFLEGYSVPQAEAYESWLQQEAQQWEHRMIQALTSLVQAYQARGDWAKAIHYAQRALLIDALHESLHQTLMMCYYLSGDRGAALAQYATCERLLGEQLGVGPDDSTRQLRGAIAAGTLPRAMLGHPTLRLSEAVTIERKPEEPLFGRDQELAQLLSVLTASAAGTTRNVLIHGGAGQGKSRLVKELLRRLPPNTFATVVQVQCRAAWMSQALWPIRNALRLSAVPVEQGVSTGQLLQALEERLRTLSGPVLVVVEDIHWADDDTGRVLDYLVHSRLADHITLVLTSREWQLKPHRYLLLRRWEAEGHLTWIDLQPLKRRDFSNLVRSRLEDASSRFIDLLEDETARNPLLALSILDALEGLEMGEIPTSSAQLPLPPYVRSLVEARMRGLSPIKSRQVV